MAKSTTLRYDFEELQPYRDLCVLVGGYADIDAEYQEAEPDVGLARGGWAFGVDEIYIDSTKPGAPATKLQKDHPLYKLIESELCGPRFADSICEMLEEQDYD